MQSYAAPFQNGSFESPALAPGASVDLPAGSTTALTGWTVGTTGLVSFANGPALGVSPVEGVQHIGFNGGNTPPGGSISQTFSTTAGQAYTVRFYVGRIGPGGGTMSLLTEVSSGTGAVLGSLAAVAPGSPGYGAEQTFTFTAATETSTLTFTDTSSATIAVDLLLDYVSVSPVSPPPPQTFLLNVDVRGNSDHVKVGLAATGQSTNDYWNVCSFPWLGLGTVTDLKLVDQAATPVSVTLANGGGYWFNATGDPMYDGYTYPDNGGGNGVGNLVLTVSNLVAGSYDFYLYGHADAAGRGESDTIFSVASGDNNYGPVGTTASPGWKASQPWEEGKQYVLFRNVRVVAGTPVVITGAPGYNGQPANGPDRPAILNGVQIVQKSSAVPPPIITAFANGSFESPALASGTGVNLAPGPGGLPGWTVGSTGLVSFRNGPAYGVAPVDGVQEIGFNGADTPVGGSISQTFSTTIGQTYQVRFNVGRQAPGSGTMSLRAEVTASGGQVLASLTGVAPNSPGYGPAQTFAFGATTTNSTLTFTDTSSATLAVDVLLDNVRVEASTGPCVTLPSGLVSWWRAENDATDVVSGNNGSLGGQTTFVSGRAGQGFSFDGAGDGVHIGNPANLRLQDLTIEAWVKRSSTAHVSASSIFGEIVGYGWGGYVFGFWPGGELFLSKHGVDNITSVHAIADTEWHHLAVTKFGSNVVFYIDGVAEPEASYDTTFVFNTDIVIGAVNDGFEASFLGAIDELSIFNRAVSPDEIARIYNAGSVGKCLPPPPAARALAHWKFDETSGSVAHDSAGSYDGVLSTTGASFVPEGMAGNALRLARSSNGLVNMGNVLPMTGGDFSISAWVRMAPGDTSQSSVVVAHHRTWFNNGYFLNVNHSGILGQDNKAMFFSGDQYQVPVSTTTVNDGSWHHLVAVHEVGANCLIYVDGSPFEGSSPTLPVIASPAPLLVGGVDDSGTLSGLFSGLIDDLQIYNYALTSVNVDFLFQNPGQEIAPHDLPTGQWRLDTVAGIGGTIARDPDLVNYTNGAVVTLSAVPNSSFAFTGWTGDVTGTNNPVTVTMTGNKTVSAGFAEIPVRLLAVVNPDPKQEGERISFDLQLTSPGDVGGMSFVVHYNPAYLKEPNLTWSPIVGSALDQVNYDTPGQIRATFALPATAVPAGTKRVATVSFRTRSVPSDLNTDLGLDLVDVSAPSGNSITTGNAARGGTARILVRRVIGDNNANDRLDVGDATIMQRFLTGLDPVRSWDVSGNDVNANTTLDSGDVVRVLRVAVDLDPQPAPRTVSATGGGLAKAGLGKAGPSGASSEVAILNADRLRGQPGDLVTVQVLLRNTATPLAGASFTLEYPTNALRLLNSLSQHTGALVPGSAVSVWNVQPAQNDYTAQNGRVLFGASSASAWPANTGVLAEFVFQVQAGQTAQYRWPIHLSGTELTADGYDVRALTDSEAYFIGRDPIPPSIGASAGGVSGGRFHLVLGGEPGMPYTIEVSTDLVRWSSFGTVTNATGALDFVDPDSNDVGRRFYRVVQQF